MADLSDTQRAESVKIVGSDSSGIESTPVQSTSNGGLHINIRDNSGNERGTESRPIYISQGISQTAITQITERRVLTAGQVYYKTENITTNTAIKELHVGGRVACEGFLAKYVAATTEQVPGGGFNSTTDVTTTWTNTSIGDSAPIAWTYATDQFLEGTGSAKHTFTKSGAGDYPEITYTWSTPKDMSGWKSIIGRARVTVAAGGAVTRTISIRLTSGTAVRIWQVTGTTTAVPFSTEQWHAISGDLENPHATAGTGTFDINAVNSISLRLVDGANKTGSIWWDDIELVGQMTILDKIYSSEGSTRQVIFDPIKVFSNGEVLMLALRNNGSTTAEIQGATSGVSIT